MSMGLGAGRAAAYQSVAAWTSTAVDDPRRLVVMLYDGALERIAHARGCIHHGMIAEKGAAIGRAIAILEELRGSLDFERGGPLAVSLDDLYGYASRRLLAANAQGDVRILDEVAGLLRELREAWSAISLEPAAP